MKKAITDRFLDARSTAAGDYFDAGFPGFGVRVAPTGRKTFVLAARFTPGANPTRRAIGVYPKITLAKARDTARDWLDSIARGVDPAAEAERQRAAEAVRRKNSVAAVAEDFISEKLATERQGGVAERDLRRDVISEWGALPVTDVSDDMCAALVKRIARKGARGKPAPSQARNTLVLVKRFFQWAVDQRVYGLRISPAAFLKASALVGERASSNRILDDDEVLALWRAIARLNEPARSVYRILVVTGLRLNEAADASWPEFPKAVRQALRDETKLPTDAVWTIPAARMKGRDKGKRAALAHEIPITAEIGAVLESLPRFTDGPFLFSTTYGKRPVWIGAKVKADLDEAMAEELAKIDSDRKFKPWKNHHIRHTVRTRLTALRIPENVAEAVIAHKPRGIVGVYDHHTFRDEKREALEAWAAELRRIVEPKPSNVTPLRRKVRGRA